MAIFRFKKTSGQGENEARGDTSASRAMTTQRTERGGVKVSVIIPVYNAMPYLTELLNSLETQDMDPQQFEVIAVNDGSTDFGNEILDVYAKRNANFRVIHQRNSGWPGKPRNVGIDAAVGDYVFFCDADDVLGSEALRRMSDYAEANDVDVLMPKMIGLGGRRVQASLFTRTRLDTPLEFILRSLSPQKMVRRSLLNDNRIRFREDKVRLEDGMAMTQCYVVSRRTSILADYDYYRIRTRSDGQNISVARVEPAGYVKSLTHIAGTITEHLAGEPEEAKKLVAGLFQRKGLRFYQGSRFLGYSDRYRQEWLKAHQQFLAEFLDGEVEGLLPDAGVRKIELIRAGDVAGLVSMAEAEESESRNPVLKRVVAGQGSLDVEFHSYARQQVPVCVVVEDRDSDQSTRFAATPSGEDGIYRASLPIEELVSNVSRLGNLSISYGATSNTVKRAGFPEDVEETVSGGVRVYRTASGYASVDVRKAE